MKLKIRVKEKDFIFFLVVCGLLFLVCAIVAVNFISFGAEDKFVGLDVIGNYSPQAFGLTIVFFIISLVFIFSSVSSTIFNFEKGGPGIIFGEKEEKGYNRWMTDKEMKKAWQVKKVHIKDENSDAGGIVLINDGKDMWVDDGEYHTLIIGQSGSGKTSALVNPQIKSLMKHNESMIITDLKGEIYREQAAELKARGYKLVVLNFRDPTEGNTWNPLTIPYRYYKQGKKDKAKELLEDISQNIIVSKDSQQDPFWETAASDYFCALALGLFEDAKENEVNITSISDMSSTGETKSGLKTVAQEYFGLKGEHSAEYEYAKSTINAPQETRQSILSVFQSKIRQFSTRENLSEMLSYSDFNMEDIGREKTAVFLIVHDEKTTYHALVTIFIKQLYEVLIDVAHKNPDGALKFRTNFILDEFANLPELKDVDSMVTAARSRRIRFTFIIQNFAQLDDTYGEKKAETIRSNCGNIIYLLTSEVKALEEISKMLGEVKSKKEDKTVSTPLATVTDLQKMKRNEIIVIRMRQKPFKTVLKAYYEVDWGNAYPKSVPPERDVVPVKIFDIKEFVKENKRKKSVESIKKARESEEREEDRLPVPNTNFDTSDPFDPDSTVNIDDLVKDIDAQIAKLEAEQAEEERKQKESQANKASSSSNVFHQTPNNNSNMNSTINTGFNPNNHFEPNRNSQVFPNTNYSNNYYPNNNYSNYNNQVNNRVYPSNMNGNYNSKPRNVFGEPVNEPNGQVNPSNSNNINTSSANNNQNNKVNVDNSSVVLGNNVVTDDQYFDDFFGDDD